MCSIFLDLAAAAGVIGGTVVTDEVNAAPALGLMFLLFLELIRRRVHSTGIQDQSGKCEKSILLHKTMRPRESALARSVSCKFTATATTGT